MLSVTVLAARRTTWTKVYRAGRCAISRQLHTSGGEHRRMTCQRLRSGDALRIAKVGGPGDCPEGVQAWTAIRESWC
ncbi:MAG: hypothetical protein WKF84_30135 [Pyrinomonadaceae bacterium]